MAVQQQSSAIPNCTVDFELNQREENALRSGSRGVCVFYLTNKVCLIGFYLLKNIAPNFNIWFDTLIIHSPMGLIVGIGALGWSIFSLCPCMSALISPAHSLVSVVMLWLCVHCEWLGTWLTLYGDISVVTITVSPFTIVLSVQSVVEAFYCSFPQAIWAHDGVTQNTLRSRSPVNFYHLCHREIFVFVEHDK